MSAAQLSIVFFFFSGSFARGLRDKLYLAASSGVPYTLQCYFAVHSGSVSFCVALSLSPWSVQPRGDVPLCVASSHGATHARCSHFFVASLVMAARCETKREKESEGEFFIRSTLRLLVCHHVLRSCFVSFRSVLRRVLCIKAISSSVSSLARGNYDAL